MASTTGVFPPPDYTTVPAQPAMDPVLAIMRGDLRRLVIAQKQYFANQGQYSDRLSALAIRYLPHAGVSVQITAAGSSGWAGRATYDGRPGASCVIWVGAVPRPATDAQRRAPAAAGTPVCDSL
jgi:hypothetical protein